MNHPLARIFAPIAMIILVAAFTVATTTVEFLPVGEATIAETSETDAFPTIRAS